MGPYFPVRTACLFTYWEIKYNSVNIKIVSFSFFFKNYMVHFLSVKGPICKESFIFESHSQRDEN